MRALKKLISLSLVFQIGLAPVLVATIHTARADEGLIARLEAAGVPTLLARRISDQVDRMAHELAAASESARNDLFRDHTAVYEAILLAIQDESSRRYEARMPAPQVESVQGKNLRLVLGMQELADAQSSGDPARLQAALEMINGSVRGLVQVSDGALERVDISEFKEQVSAASLAAIHREFGDLMQKAVTQYKLDPLVLGLRQAQFGSLLQEGLRGARLVETLQVFRPNAEPVEIVNDAKIDVEADVVVLEPVSGTREPARPRITLPEVPSGPRMYVKVIKIIWPDRKNGELGLIDRFTILVGKGTETLTKVVEVYRSKLRERSRVAAERRATARAQADADRATRNAERDARKAQREREVLDRETLRRIEAEARYEARRTRVEHRYEHYGNPSDPGSSLGAWFRGGLLVIGHSLLGVSLGLPIGFAGGVVGGLFLRSETLAEIGVFGGFGIPVLVGLYHGLRRCGEHLTDHSDALREYERRRRY